MTVAPGLPEHPSGWHFKNNLRRAVHEFAAGNHSDFARRSGISLDSVYHWLHIDSCAHLVSVLRMCTNLRLSAARFISEHIPGNDPDWERTRQFAMQPSREPNQAVAKRNGNSQRCPSNSLSHPPRAGDKLVRCGASLSLPKLPVNGLRKVRLNTASLGCLHWKKQIRSR